MTAIERDHYEPELRGRAFINLKSLPNGHYTIYYLRIGQPISIKSRLKVLGKASQVFVNINRDKISECKKPQLDLAHSSSRISKTETSKFKILKAAQSKERDNKVLALNSEDEMYANEAELDEQLQKDLSNMFGGSKAAAKGLESGTPQPESSERQAAEALEMEFEESSLAKEEKKVVPPPLMDSKEYYNNTQRLTEAMIQNPQFQIFSIDEEEKESVRTSNMDSIRESVERDSLDLLNGGSIDGQTPGFGAEHSTPMPHSEDAFRDSHLEQTTPDLQPAEASVSDSISQQIEDYQREQLMNLSKRKLEAEEAEMSTRMRRVQSR